MKARDFIRAGEHGLVIFTHGGHFELHPDHTGSTGYWVMDGTRQFDHVIIYHRDDATHINSVYVATFVQADPVEDDRFNVQFNHVQYVGVTDANWIQFAEGGQNPVRYLS